jgi:hypothetical protein
MSAAVRSGLCAGIATLAMLAAATAGASSALAASPWWHLAASVRPSTLKQGGEATIGFRALNVGDAPTTTENAESQPTPVVITATLPPGVNVQKAPRGPGEPEEPKVTLHRFPETNLGSSFCSEPAARQIRCSYESSFGPLLPFEYTEMSVAVSVESNATSGPAVAEVTGGGTSSASLERELAVGTGQPVFGVEEQGFSIVPEEEGGAVDARAGSHPFQLTTNFALNQTADTVNPPALPKKLQFTLPAGLVANAATFPRCDELAFLTKGPGNGFADLCPAEAAVGVVALTIKEPEFGSESTATYPVPVFNLAPKLGEPARFGFYFNGITVTIDFSVRTGGDYGATATVDNITQIANFISETLTVWGVPGNPSHNSVRGWGCVGGGFFQFPAGQPPCTPSTQSHPAPFLTLPTSCAGPFAALVEGVSWPTKASPEGVALADVPQNRYSLEDSFERPIGITSCNQLPFAPSIEVAPDVQEASTAAGVTVHVHVPQEVNENARGLASSAVKDITVALPEGVSLNPAGAGGLQACGNGQIGFKGTMEFNPETEPGSKTLLFSPTVPEPLSPGLSLGALGFCPNAAKVGTVKIKSPLLANPLEGAVYLASQNENPFGSLVAIYIVAEDPVSGTLVKLPGKIELAPSGQIITTFANAPQLPFADAEVHLFGGEHAALATPAHCGNYTTEATFAPWSGSEPVSSQSRFAITAGAHGGPCPGPTLPFSPSLIGGTTSSAAGAFSPLTATISREDGNQDIHAVQLRMPEGLEGVLAGVKLCPEAQANEGTCGAESQIGETTVSAGVGNEPVIVPGGKVYITERYAGAPFGLSIVSPAKAGPFDLEHDTANSSQQPSCDCVVVRAKIEVDPHTAALTATTDTSGAHAIPQAIDGVPLEIKRITVLVNRKHFTFNPTNCGALSITGAISSYEGAIAPLSAPFQAVNCAVLKFTPKVTVTTAAKASKANGASLNFRISYPAGAMGSQSWFKEARFDIPKQLPARLTTIQKACLASVFQSNPAACPPGSLIGHAVVHTPVLPVPLMGPVYFVSYGSAKFPDAVLVLQGYGITVDVVGETFINKKTGVTSATFASNPDVPFENVEVSVPRGSASEFAANLPAAAKYSFCGQRLVIPTLFKAQNGAEIEKNIPVGVTGCAHRRSLTKAQKLAKAMKSCEKQRKGRRAVCARRARRRYGGH